MEASVEVSEESLDQEARALFLTISQWLYCQVTQDGMQNEVNSTLVFERNLILL